MEMTMHNRKVVAASDVLTLESAAILVTLFSAMDRRSEMFGGVVVARTPSIHPVISIPLSPRAGIGGPKSENS
jgi:hypothetical protein